MFLFRLIGRGIRVDRNEDRPHENCWTHEQEASARYLYKRAKFTKLTWWNALLCSMIHGLAATDWPPGG